MFMFVILVFYPVFAEEEDNFDWARYLMEGEDIDTGPYPDTPVSTIYHHIFHRNKIHKMLHSTCCL